MASTHAGSGQDGACQDAGNPPGSGQSGPAQSGLAQSGPAQSGPAQRGRRPRNSLSPEMIVAESLRLLDANGLSGFSLPKLGRAIGADPTAVYRHFSRKDELILAIADRLIEEATAGITLGPCWPATVEELVRRLRSTYRRHPAAASLSAYRTTQRQGEMHAVNVLIGAVLQAGFEGAAAARVYRALGDFALAWAGGEANLLALDPGLQAADRAAWRGAYLAADRATFPHIWQMRDELPEVTEDDIFENILAIVMAGISHLAPRPCECPRHGGYAAAPGDGGVAAR